MIKKRHPAPQPSGREVPLSSDPCYFPPQSQCDELLWLPGQQLAPGLQHAEPPLQHAAPTAAIAETANNDVAIKANNFVFIGKTPLKCEKGRSCARTICAPENTAPTLRGLNSKVVLQKKHCGPIVKPRRPLLHRLRRAWLRTVNPGGRDRALCLIPARPVGLRFSLFRYLLGATRARAALAGFRPRAAGHVAPPAMHRWRHCGIGERECYHPHCRQRQCQRLHPPPIDPAQHRLSLSGLRQTQSDLHHDPGRPTGSRIIFSDAGRFTDRTMCGVITIASSPISRLLFLFVVLWNPGSSLNPGIPVIALDSCRVTRTHQQRALPHLHRRYRVVLPVASAPAAR